MCPGGVRKKNDEFKELVESGRQAGKIRHGEMSPSGEFDYKPADIKAIREKLGKSQAEFSLMNGVSLATIHTGNWDGTACAAREALLKVAKINPKAVADALEV